MTVEENLALGLGFPRRGGLIQWKSVSQQAEEVLAQVGGGILPSTRIHRLSRTDRSLVAIARALAANAELLVRDEPTASLPLGSIKPAVRTNGKRREVENSPAGSTRIHPDKSLFTAFPSPLAGRNVLIISQFPILMPDRSSAQEIIEDRRFVKIRQASPSKK
jgi:hypothetical protein